MIICPLMSNPDVAREFNEIKDATTEKTAYNVWSKNNGNGIDKAPNGEPSILFAALLNKLKNRVRAIRQKAKYYGNNFLELFGNWIDDPGSVIGNLDKNGEPDVEYDEDAIERFIDKLIPRKRMYVGKKQFILHIADFYKDLLGVELEISKVSSILQLKDETEFFIFNRFDEYLDKQIEKYSAIKEDLDNIPFRNVKLLKLRLIEFLDSDHDVSEYDQKFLRLIKQVFPNLFNDKNTPLMKGWYKHVLLNSNPTERGSKETKAKINKILSGNNLAKYKVDAKLKKLTSIKQAIQKYPGLKSRIKRRLFNEIDLTENRNVIPKEVARNADDKNTKGDHGIFSISSMRFENGKVYSAIQVASELKKNPKYKTIAEKIEKCLRQIGDCAIIPSDKKYSTVFYAGGENNRYSEKRDYSGVYRTNLHIIELQTREGTFVARPEEVILHEMIHAVTSLTLDNVPEIRSALDDYIRYCISFSNTDIRDYYNDISVYGLSNADEFIAEYFANPEFLEYLKHIPAMDDKKFNNIFEEIFDIILRVLGIRNTDNAYEQIRPILFSIIDILEATAKPNTRGLSVFEKEDTLQLYSTIDDVSPVNAKYMRELNNVNRDINSYAAKQLLLRAQNESDIDTVSAMQDAKKLWIEEHLKLIIGETQLKLAEAYGLRQVVGEDGIIRFVSENNDDKTNLIIDFLDYIGGDHQGYYDHNSTSSAAHHVIAISLTEGDPSTFDHELAHHYIRMFWNSKLIQTSLRAVYKEGMSNEEVEEALVDVITARTTDTEFMSCIEDQSFFLKFWAALANILYSTFGIENEAIRNQLYANITRAFALNEQQRALDAEKQMFLMHKGRMFKSKTLTAAGRAYRSTVRAFKGVSKYRKKLSKTRDENRQKDVLIEYEKVNATPLHDAIQRIAQGTVSRNKEFRRSLVTNPEMQVLMQIQETAVKNFLQDIKEFRQKYLKDHGLENKKRLTEAEKELMINTQEEKDANINLITSFIETARTELTDVIEKLISAKKSEYTHYIQEEIVDPNTGDVKIQYIPATIQNMQDLNLDRREFTFDEIMSMYQNVIGFYSSAIKQLDEALKDGKFEAVYGHDVTELFLQEVSDGSASLVSTMVNVETMFNNATKSRIESFCVSYVQNAMKGQSDDLIQRATYSVRQWLANQSTWGDVGGLDSFLKLPSHSASNLVRMLLDIVDNINYETHRESEDKAKTLQKLRKKAIKSLGWKSVLYGALSPFNFDKMFIEKNNKGIPTGNFLGSVNKGQYYQDREKFIDDLLFGKGGIEKQIRERSGDYHYEIEFDTDGEPIFPEGFEDLENDFLHKLNHWTSKHAIRPFTEEYYDLKIDMLSRKTRDAQKAILKDINDIIGACTINGKVHTELLNSSKAKQLKILYNQKSQLASIYDEFGNEKPVGSDERLIAEELMAWNDVVEDKIEYKKDTEAYEAAKANSRNPDIFEKQNSYPIMNPLIWDEIEKLSPLVENDRIKTLRKYRNQLKHIIVGKGLVNPRIQDVWDESTKNIRVGYEGFWENLKKIDEELGLLLNEIKSAKPRTLALKLAIAKLVQKADVKKTGVGVWRLIIEQQVKLRIQAENPGDPLWKQKFDEEMRKFKAEIKDSKGNLKEIVPLSIFSIRMPARTKTTINGETVLSITREPILAYSVIDPEHSSNRFVDKRYNFNSNDLIQPITDKTIDKTDSEQVSYTNQKYKEYIENGSREVLNYFRALQNTMKQAYANIPFAGQYDGRLVQKSGTARQVYLTNPWNPLKPLWYWAKRLFFINDTDTEINIDYQLRPDGSRSMNVPVRYIRRLNNPREINTDVLGSVIDFYTMSVNYKNKSRHLSEVQTILYRTELGNKNRKGQINAIKGIINRQFYERLRVLEFNEDNGVSYKQNITKMMLKILPLFRSISTVGLLALNWVSAAVAWADPALLVLTEAICGKNYNMGDYIASIFYVLKSLPSAIASIGSTNSSGILGSHTVGGMAYFNLGRTVTERYSKMDRSKIGRFLAEDIVMRPFSIGEYTVNAQIYEIVMHQYKAFENMDTHKFEFMRKREWLQHAYNHGVDLKTARMQWHTNMNTLHSAYHIDKNGKFARKRNELGRILTDDFEKQISKEMRSKSTIANLIVPQTERTGLQTNIVAGFASVMRTFMLVAISERAKSLHDFQIDDPSSADETKSLSDRKELKQKYWRDKGGFNFQTRTIDDGIWKGFWACLSRSRYYKYLIWLLAHPMKSTIDDKTKVKKEELQIADTDLYAMDRFLTEVGIFLFFMVADIMWHNKIVGDDDDDKYWYQLSSHLLMRIAIVRMTFFSPDTVLDLITSVTASTSDLQNKLAIVDLLLEVAADYSQHGWNFDEWEKVKGQSAYKGKPKALRSLFKTLSGLGLHASYSSSNVEGMKAKTKWYLRLNKWKSQYDKKEKQPKQTSKKSSGRFDNNRFSSSRFDNSNRFDNRFN